MRRISSRNHPAFTLLESLLMLVILSIWCVVTFAVVKARMRNPAPAPSVANPQAVPTVSLPKENSGTGTGVTEKSPSQKN